MHIQENYSLRSHNTFGISVFSRYFIEIDNLEVLKNALYWQQVENIPFYILGGGSNVVFTQDFEGIVLWMNIKGKTVIQENEARVMLNIKAGENWHETVLWTLEQGYNGLENLALIPGSVGAAPIQNIGAYGVEVKEVIECVEVFDTQQNNIYKIVNAECRFGYRDSIFKQQPNRFVVISVTLHLKKTISDVNLSYAPIAQYFKSNKIKNPTPFEVARVVMDIRQSKLPDPKVLGNCGSFFKNPVVPISVYEQLKSTFPDVPSFKIPNDSSVMKIPAGWLIEQSGFKGKKTGNVGVHEHQALVLVNLGGATGMEVFEFSQHIIKTIENQFGIRLETEVNMV